MHIATFELIQVAQTPGVSQDDIVAAEHGFINMIEALLVPGSGDEQVLRQPVPQAQEHETEQRVLRLDEHLGCDT